MSEPTIEDVVDMGYWKSVRCGHLDSTNRVLGAATALMAVLRELEQLGGTDPFRQALMLLDIRDRIRAALGDAVK